MRESLASKTYKAVYNDIYYYKKYSPNDFIIEQEVADAHGVSKGTASEALHRLCMEGHIVSYPRKGYQVAVITHDEAQKAQRLRLAVESLAVKVIIKEVSDEKMKAFYDSVYGIKYETEAEEEPDHRPAPGGNDIFHQALVELTEDQYIINTEKTLLSVLSRVTLYLPFNPRYVKTVEDYHHAICEALMQRDEKKALEYLEKDLNGFFPIE